MTYRDRIFALAAHWAHGANAEAVLALLPEERRAPVEPGKDGGAKLSRLLRREQALVDTWGRKRFGASWDQVEPRVRAALVRRHG